MADGETPLAALKRELREELEFTPQTCEEFTRFDFDFSKLGQSKIYRIYYEVPVRAAAFGKFVLHEGTAFEAVDGGDLLTMRNVTPYDAFAIWTHMHASRLKQVEKTT